MTLAYNAKGGCIQLAHKNLQNENYPTFYVKCDKLVVWLQWAIIISNLLFTCIVNRIRWSNLLIYTLVGWRYLLFPIYPQAKQDVIHQQVDNLRPLNVLMSYFLRQSDVPFGNITLRIVGFAIFLVLMVWNGYVSLWLETTNYSVGTKKTPTQDEFDALGHQYHLLPLQVKQLRQLAQSGLPQDQQKLQAMLKDMQNFQLAKQLHPLGISYRSHDDA